MKVEKGKKVKIDYTGTLDDGTVFDTTDEKTAKENNCYQEQRPYQPLEIEVGAKQVIPGFEDALIGMEKGEEKEIHLEAEEAYGEPTDKAIQEVPKETLGENFKAEPGTKLFFKAQGQIIMGVLKEIKDKTALIDFNHPLAGKALNFKIKVVDIS